MEKCQYHDELWKEIRNIKEDIGDIKEGQSAMKTTLDLIVGGKIKLNGSNYKNGRDKTVGLALEAVKYALAITGGVLAAQGLLKLF